MLQAGDPPPDEAPRGADGPGSARGAGPGASAWGENGDRRGDERVVAFDAAVAEVAALVRPAYRQADGWLEGTRAALLELLRFCDERPDTARALVVESIVWGPAALERRGQLLDALAGALDRGREQTDPARVPPVGTAENLVGACVSLVHTRLLQGGDGSFAELAPSLMGMIVHPYLGAEAARRELERPLTDAGAEAVGREFEGRFSAARDRAR
jgi:hypothetical protein